MPGRSACPLWKEEPPAGCPSDSLRGGRKRSGTREKEKNRVVAVPFQYRRYGEKAGPRNISPGWCSMVRRVAILRRQGEEQPDRKGNEEKAMGLASRKNTTW